MSDTLLRYRTEYLSYGETMVAWDRTCDFIIPRQAIAYYAYLGYVVKVELVRLTASSYELVKQIYTAPR